MLHRLKTELSVAIEAQRRTQQGATHEESKPENDKDTRAIESSYLARGQAQRVVELEDAVNALRSLTLREFGPDDAVAIGALVQVSDGQVSRQYFLVPAGGGNALEFDGQVIYPVTPRSPVGRALLGKQLDEDVEFRSPSGLKEWVIEQIC